MIYGIGTDFVKIDRIRKIVSYSGDRLASRILSISELKMYKRSKYPIHFLSKRFAAKEAASKAFGIGICHGLFFKHFEIFNDVFGKPTLRLIAYAETLFHQLSLSRIHVTLSDDGCYVIAIVVFER